MSLELNIIYVRFFINIYTVFYITVRLSKNVFICYPNIGSWFFLQFSLLNMMQYHFYFHPRWSTGVILIL